MLIIPYITRRSRWMMAHLLSHQPRCARLIFPFPNKQLSKKWIERFHPLLLSILIFIAVLLFQGAQKPF
jgi:hypothetical protein